MEQVFTACTPETEIEKHRLYILVFWQQAKMLEQKKCISPWYLLLKARHTISLEVNSRETPTAVKLYKLEIFIVDVKSPRSVRIFLAATRQWLFFLTIFTKAEPWATLLKSVVHLCPFNVSHPYPDMQSPVF